MSWLYWQKALTGSFPSQITEDCLSFEKRYEDFNEKFSDLEISSGQRTLLLFVYLEMCSLEQVHHLLDFGIQNTLSQLIQLVEMKRPGPDWFLITAFHFLIYRGEKDLSRLISGSVS